jgi:hypothetical protein
MFARSFTRLRCLAAAVAALSLAAASAEAASVTALGNPFNQVATTTSQISGTTWFATGFTTGTNADFLSLTGVKLSLATSGTVTTSNPVIKLFTGVSNPTTEFATLSGSPITSASPVTATYVPTSSPLSLLPNTSYWVVLSAEVGDQFSWYTTDENPVEQNGSGFTFISGKRSLNAGSTWNNSVTAGAGAVAIEVQAVPEPSTIMLAGIGVFGALVVDRSRRQRNRRRQLAAGDVSLDDSESLGGTERN